MLLLLVLGACPSVFANNVTVGCAGAVGVFDYSSLHSALDALHAISNRNHKITVSGTCTESATVSDFENLQIIGNPGATLTDPGPNAPGDPNAVLLIRFSINILIQGLTLQGLGSQGRTLSILFDSLGVKYDKCTFQNAPAGIFLHEGSVVTVTQSTIQNNDLGIRVSGSVMRLGVPGGSIAQSYVQNNVTGIQVDENAQMNVNTTSTIQNNSGIGINVTGGRLRLCCSGNIQILNNLRGIAVNYGSVDMIGPVLIQGNTGAGILLIGSQANLTGGQTIQQNGGGGGIVALGSSHLDLFDSQVSNNAGSGVVLRDNSSGAISGNTITGNRGNGVTLFVLSSVTIDGTTITGNGGIPVSCSFHSFAYSDSGPRIKKLCPGGDDDDKSMDKD